MHRLLLKRITKKKKRQRNHRCKTEPSQRFLIKDLFQKPIKYTPPRLSLFVERSVKIKSVLLFICLWILFHYTCMHLRNKSQLNWKKNDYVVVAMNTKQNHEGEKKSNLIRAFCRILRIRRSLSSRILLCFLFHLLLLPLKRNSFYHTSHSNACTCGSTWCSHPSTRFKQNCSN